MERDRIRRALPMAAAWLGAAVVAAVVASQGVALVTREVTDRRPASLTAAEIEHRLDEVQGTATADSTPSPAASDTTTSTAPAGPATSAPTTTGPTTTVAPTGRPQTPPVTSAPSATPAPTTTAAPPSETRTYTLQGGTVALEFSSSGVTVVYATPAAGYEVDVEPEHGNGVKVEFENEGHRSRVDGWWEGGPVDRVREEDT